MQFFSLLLQCFLLIAFSSVNAQENATAKKQSPLNFEQALYEHLQEHYLNAITLSEVLSKKSGSTNIKQQVLLSTSYYRYLLPKQSLELLKQGLSKKINKNDEDILLFQIAKNHYKNKQLSTALMAFNKIIQPINPAITAELYYLKADTLILQNELAKADKIALKLQGDTEFFPYIAHNLGIAYLNNKNLKKALYWIKALNDERYLGHQDLKDSLRLSSGIFYIRQKNYPEAIKTLLSITKDSKFAAKGLLALGKALVLNNDISEGKRFYNYLSNDPKQNIYYQESLLNLAESDNTGSKIQLFKHAINNYNTLIEQIDLLSSSDHIEGISTCLVKNPLNPVCQNLHRWLGNFEKSDLFKTHLTQNKQLLTIQHTLFTWSQTLTSFEFILKQRKNDFNQKLPKISQQLKPEYLKELLQKFNILKAEVKKIKQNSAKFALINDDESDQLDDISYVDVSIKRITSLQRFDQEVIQQLQARAQFTKGILMWDLAQKKPLRLRQVSKNIKQLKQLLEQSKQGISRLQKFNQIGDQRLSRLTQTLVTTKNILYQLQNKVDRLIAQNQQQLTELTQAYLIKRKTSLIYLNSRSKFLLTQLQDVQ